MTHPIVWLRHAGQQLGLVPSLGGSVAAWRRDATDGGAHVLFDFVGEHGAELLAPKLLRNRGQHYVIGYGGEVRLPTIEAVIREISVVGNLVGTYQDLVELMALTAQGRVTLHTKKYPLDAALDAIHDLESGAIRGRGILIP